MSEALQVFRNKSFWGRANLVLTYMLVFSFPFPLYFSLKILGLWILVSLVTFDWQKIKQTEHKAYFVIVILYSLLFIIGMFYTQDINGGLHQLGIKLYILLFPFLFVSSRELYKPHVDKILSWFVFGQVVAMIVLYVIAFYHSTSFVGGHLVFDPRVDKKITLFKSLTGDYNYFFYTAFSVMMHPLYASYEVVVAIAVLVFLKRNPYMLDYGKIARMLQKNILFYPLLIFLSISVFLLGSRTNLISISILLFFVVLSSSIRPKSLRITLSLVILSLSVAVILYNPRSQILARSVENYKEMTWQEKIKRFSRVYFWISAYEIGSAHPIFGVGTGDLQWHLYRKYAMMKMSRYLEPSFNSHNEFLEHFGRLGILGLGLLLAILLYAFFYGLRHKRKLLVMFIVITAVNFTFEVLLNRAWGTTFFAFFLNFLLLIDFKDNREIEPHT